MTNEPLLSALESGPLFVHQVAKACGISCRQAQRKLYRMESKFIVRRIPQKREGRVLWALFTGPIPAKDAGNKVAPRSAPNWRTSTLSYDLDAHRKLALLAR